MFIVLILLVGIIVFLAISFANKSLEPDFFWNVYMRKKEVVGMEEDDETKERVIRVINGLRYDTATATLVHRGFEEQVVFKGRRGTEMGTEPYVYADLYVTPKGAYFLRNYYGLIDPSNYIEPFTKQEAMEWLAAYGGDNVLNSHFGEQVLDA